MTKSRIQSQTRIPDICHTFRALWMAEMPAMTKRLRAGVTLLELLVVIVLISALAGILLPVFLRSRESGRRAVCMGNLRQLAAAVQMYAADYDGVVPIQYRGAKLLNGRLENYGVTPDVLVCPSEPGNAPNIKPGPCWLGGDSSYEYYPNSTVCTLYGFHDPLRLAPTSPLFLCALHSELLDTYSVARYDGSVVLQRELPPEPRLIVE